MPSRLCALLAVAIVLVASATRAEDPPPNYFAGFAGTTLGYHPDGGPWDGYQHDLTTTLGYGRYVRPTLALELDLGPTFVKGDYASFALVPGVVWAFNPSVYAAARFVVPVDPELDFTLAPGLGLSHTFGRYTPILEVNALHTVGKGGNLAITATVGLLVSF